MDIWDTGTHFNSLLWCKLVQLFRQQFELLRYEPVRVPTHQFTNEENSSEEYSHS
jgi:hypothetical protein